ncbi:MAG: isoprenylcysteine carboxylmethyltransferase family protein [Chitinophagales bacterium]|nr:isoprenylcysteine carboxylmethyltransferase family protein [Chitinophagales bacterium]
MFSLKNASLAGLLIAIVALAVLITCKLILADGIVAIVVQAIAVLLMIWARLTFGFRSFHASADPTSGGLVTTGPYKYLRHPIYAAVIYFTCAGISSHLSILSVMMGIAVVAGLSIRMVAEEQLVAKQYPDYKSYSAKTKRVIPFIL